MKVAVEWVRSFGDFAGLTDQQLADKLTMAGLEVEETHGSGNDTVFVTKVTPNRGDWMSIYGVAREAAAAAALPLKPHKALTALPAADSIGSFTAQVVDGTLCPRFSTAIITNVSHRPSPQFIQQRLILSGMRPLNAVVDITNYVMLELGQPLHAYDLAKLRGPKIIVRPAADGETIKTLDGTDHALTSEILVIADGEVPIAAAGIMGGAETEVTETTTDIVLESAHFDASVVRRGAKKLGFSTEASYRFERFVDPELVPIALALATELIAQYAGGTPAGVMIDRIGKSIQPVQIKVRTQRVNDILGLLLSPGDVGNALIRLGLLVERSGDDLTVLVPTFRPDLKLEIDLIEEVGRMVGYWNLPETVPLAPGAGAGDFDKGCFDSVLRTALVGQGLTECYSHTLGSTSVFDEPTSQSRRVTVRSSLSTELSGLRLTLLPHLLDALALNLRFGAPAVRLFEVGKVFQKDGIGLYAEPRHVAAALSGHGADYTTAKGIVENLMSGLGIQNVSYVPAARHAMHPGRTVNVLIRGELVGYIAELDPYVVAESLELPPSTGRIAAFELDAELLRTVSEALSSRRYVPLPKFPSVSRDIALIYDLSTTYGSILSAVKDEAGELLEDVTLLSVYTGERVQPGKKSVALRLIFRSRTRTLTDSDAEAAVAAIRSALTNKLGAADR